jgi:hypothetical protein
MRRPCEAVGVCRKGYGTFFFYFVLHFLSPLHDGPDSHCSIRHGLMKIRAGHMGRDLLGRSGVFDLIPAWGCEMLVGTLFTFDC